MENSIKDRFLNFKKIYKSNPAWYWLLFTIFTFFLLPEYISPFIMFVAFIIFKRQWTREGRLAKVGTMGKLEMILMTYMLVSVFWSPTKLDTLGCAGLWWACILVQIMIYNLARTKHKIKRIITTVVLSASLNGFVASIQMLTYTLFANGKIDRSLVLVTPFYRYLDIAIYNWLPFEISTKMWVVRASGFFSNPNLLATFMIVAFPLAVYLFLNASSKKSATVYFAGIFCITAGLASTLTRAGCLIMLAEWVFLFFMLIKRHSVKMLSTFIPTGGVLIPAILTRYGIIKTLSNVTNIVGVPIIAGDEALKSSEAHFDIWKSMIDYIIHHVQALLVGTGFGMEQSGKILLENYALNKPHSHNFIIEIWVELGLVGIVMLAIIMIFTMGKLIEINSNTRRKITLVFAVSTSFVSFFVFGLSDYIFNSPKQIIMMMILIGITQAMSYVYDKTLINSPKDLEKVAKRSIYNIIHQ